jgi:dihydropteroate synthase
MVASFSFLDRVVTVVGIVNVTPDSFSDGGRYLEHELAVTHALRLVADGAHLIDVGGESTRPGATPVTVDDELRRVVPVIERLAATGVPVSVDTRRAVVASAAIAAGAVVVNDVTGLRDPAMRDVVAAARVPAIVMHAPSADMGETHRHGGYVDVVAEVTAFLAAQVSAAREAGVEEIVVDPGIGFGKGLDDNVALLHRLDELVGLGCPVLVGASRKRFLGTITGVTEAADRDVASIAAHLVAVQHGATAVRVHDVAGHVQALAVLAAIESGRSDPGV